MKLKPCPHCGSEAEIRDVYYQSRNWALQEERWTEKEVACISCNAHSNHFKKESNAVEAWNRRHNESIYSLGRYLLSGMSKIAAKLY